MAVITGSSRPRGLAKALALVTFAAGALMLPIAQAPATADTARTSSVDPWPTDGDDSFSHRLGCKKKKCGGDKCNFVKKRCPQQGVDTAFFDTTKFVGFVDGRGALKVRDPRTTPVWHDLSGLSGNPGEPTDISLAVENGNLHVTVVNRRGSIAQTTCRISPTPGTDSVLAWPRNCGDFVNLTPPH